MHVDKDLSINLSNYRYPY